ncbi:MAG: phosphatidylglycerophosphatase A [Bacteroidetes bacterium]|nr:phosphatidylglycerophosphatase A [Bacteroidota bacterium]
MVFVHRLISTCLGIGYTPKGGGTVAAVVCCIGWYFAWAGGNEHFLAHGGGVTQGGGSGQLLAQVLVTVLVTAIGIYSAGKMEPYWGKDSYRVVIDEAAGMCLTLLFVPVRWQYVAVGLVLFRFFDIAKPLYIRKMEKLGGGWGVMMDDLLAGLYANLLLQVVVLIKPW